MVVEADHFTL